MEDALQRIAALASSLKEAELRILLELTRRANEDRQATQSTRQLAESTGLSRSNVTAAIHSLAERGLIQTDGGSATRASSYQLSFLETVLLERGPITGPPLYKERARPPGSIDIDLQNPIDRLLKAKPKRCDPQVLAHFQSWLHGYMAKFGHEPHPHPPDEQLTA